MDCGRQCHAVLQTATLVLLLFLCSGVSAEGATSGKRHLCRFIELSTSFLSTGVPFLMMPSMHRRTLSPRG